MERAVDEFRVKEKELLDGALRGAVDSFGGLVEMYQERAIRIAASFVGMSDARDLAQEAFIKAWENLGRFKGESRFYTWFYRILANVCKDHLRKKMRTNKVFIRMESTDGAGEERPAPDAADGRTPDSRRMLLNAELGAKIREGLETLPFQQRTAFSLRYLDGLSLEDIAGSMELSVGAVKAHLWQAGSKMKRHLGAYLRA